MSYIMVDVETDGPIPPDYSMICFGAVIVDERLDKKFYGQLSPISDQWISERLEISGFTREQVMQFEHPRYVMQKFDTWLKTNGKSNPIFVSDNNGYDWQFINYYFHRFLHDNPFGYSSMNLGSLYKGMVKDTSQNFKHLRKTVHTHHLVDDVVGNAEALLYLRSEMGLKIELG